MATGKCENKNSRQQQFDTQKRDKNPLFNTICKDIKNGRHEVLLNCVYGVKKKI